MVLMGLKLRESFIIGRLPCYSVPIKFLYFLYEKQDRDYLCVWKRVSIPLYILFPLQYCMTVQFRLLSEQ